ncbi:MAG: hypothetical protein AAF802_04000 [Planctomycetota bacterium]
MTESSDNKPAAKIRLGRISTTIWKRRNSEGKPFYRFNIESTYKDDAGEYQTSNSFSLNEALLVSKVADLADTRIRELQDADRDR